MRIAIVASTLLALSTGALAGTKFQPIRKYDTDHTGNGLYPAGFSASVKGARVTVTDLATRKRFIGKLDPAYQPREARFLPYSMFRGTFKFDKWTTEAREVLLDLGDLTGKRAYIRYHGDQWGGVEIYKPAQK